MVEFADHFAPGSAAYAAHRPSYPTELIAFLAQHAPARQLAWDCGTGSGQAAVLLASSFDRVIATDASARQLEHAQPHARIEYRELPAERSELAASSVDLVTVAQALHWFPLDAFFAEVRRVLKPAGVLAVWTYGRVKVDSDVDRIVDEFYHQRVGSYWPAERRHVEAGYTTLPFPFAELPNGPWAIDLQLDRQGFLDYVGTWSAVMRYRAVEGTDPLPDLDAALARVWPDATGRRARWPIAVRVGRRPDAREGSS